MAGKKPQYVTVKEGAAPAAAADSTSAAAAATMSKPLAQLK